MPVMSTTQPVY